MGGRTCVCLSRRLAGHVKTSLLLTLLLSSLALFGLSLWTYAENGLAYPCPNHAFPGDNLSDPWHHQRSVVAPLVKVCIAMLGALVMEFYSDSAHLQLSSWLGLVNWQIQVGVQAFMLLDCHRPEASQRGSGVWLLRTGVQVMCFVAMGVMIAMFGKVVYERWLTLEIKSGGQRAGTWRRCFRCLPVYPLLGVILFAACALFNVPYQVLFTSFLVLTPGLFACFVWLAWPSLRLILSARRAASSAALPGRAQRIRQAANSVSLQFVGSLAAGGSTALYGLVQTWGLSVGQDVFFQRAVDMVTVLDVCCNTFLMLCLAGILSGAGRSARLRSRLGGQRQGRWRRNREAWRQRQGQSKAEAEAEAGQLQMQWDEKVRELAGRGVSLDALLQFYRQTLPGLMPHFDPGKHTTGNIVFEAVIPYTSKEGCAAAELIMAGGSVLPQTMVNKFDDMMRYLSAENPAFEQVVAVDAKCDLFWRAWCVAEIATAHETGMPQTLKVTSPDCLEANLEKFSQLKIEDMHASRQEDKELILGRIEDHENFNRTLRHTLLHEVIPAWSSLDASEQMSLAGCVIRWQRVSKQVGDPAMWAA